MGLFGNYFDSDVEKATNEKNTTEDWAVIMDICDKVGNSPANAKECLKSIVKRLNNPDPHVVLKAITLLDACVNNCGKSFHLEIASRDFETEYRKLLTKSHVTVQQKLKELLKNWTEKEFKADPQLNLIPSLYGKLKSEGVDFSAPPDMAKKAPALSKDPNVVNTQQEADDIAKAIELSLKEKSGSPRASGNATASGATASLYPSANLAGGSAVSAPGPSSDARKVRALYDFEAAEDNELTFVAGEIIHVIDDSDQNWWKGYNQRGEGLFPSNFVTADLSVEPEQLNLNQQSKKSVQFDEAASLEQQAAEAEPQEVEINEEKIDRLLHLLHEADPSDDQQDPKEMLTLEEQVNNMGPLIDTELERVDRKHAQLTQLSADLVEALNLYHTLMREPQFSTVPKGMYRGFSAQPPLPHHPMMSEGLPPHHPFAANPFVGGPPPSMMGPMEGRPSTAPAPYMGLPPPPGGAMTLPHHFHMGGPIPMGRIPGLPDGIKGNPGVIIGPQQQPHVAQQFPPGAMPNYGMPLQQQQPPPPFPGAPQVPQGAAVGPPTPVPSFTSSTSGQQHMM